MKIRSKAVSVLLTIAMLLYAIAVPGVFANVEMTLAEPSAMVKDGRMVIHTSGTASGDTVLVLLLRPNADGSAFDPGQLDAGKVNAAASQVRDVQQVSVRRGAFEVDFYMTSADQSGTYTVVANNRTGEAALSKPVAYVGTEEQDALVAAVNAICAGAGSQQGKAESLAAYFSGLDENQQVSASLMGIRLDWYLALPTAAAKAEACMTAAAGGGYTRQTLPQSLNNGVIMSGIGNASGWQAIKNAVETYQEQLQLVLGERYEKLGSVGEQKFYETVQSYSKGGAAATVAGMRGKVDEWLVLARVNSAMTPTQMLTVLGEESGELGLSLSLLPSSDYDKTAVLTALIGKNFLDYASVRTAYQNALPQTGGGSGTSGSTGGGNGHKTGSVTVEPKLPVQSPAPTAEPGGFSDLDAANWARPAIEHLAEKKVLSGFEDGTFRPNDPTKREELVKMMIMAFDLQQEGAVCDFTDVPADAWFYPYVAAGSALGITNGMGDGSFGVGGEIVRADLAAMLYRTFQLGGGQLPVAAEQKAFADAERIPDYAAEAVAQLQGAGVIGGREDGSFDPMAAASRAEVAKMIDSMLRITENQ